MRYCSPLTGDDRTPSLSIPGKTVIGMTGGVGAGKSFVLTILRERYGAFILEADRVSKSLIEKNGSAYDAVIGLLGSGILDPSGEIDKGKMASLIFQDPGLLSAVNRILHPATFEAVVRQIRQAEETLIVYESALPHEARFPELCRHVLYVYTPKFQRIERLQASRGSSREKCESIMRNQLTEAAYRSCSDAVLYNNGTPEETAKRLERIMKKWGLAERS